MESTVDGMMAPSMNTELQRIEEKIVQTEPWTKETSVNTEDGWESLMRSVEDYGAHLALKYETTFREQETIKMQDESQIKILEQKKKDGIQQQQALMDKIESLREKLELNCCKTTRKNFNVKKQELNGKCQRLEEERTRLSLELEDADRKLTSLTEEQTQEKQAWEKELADLHKELERLHREAEEACQAALSSEVSALEIQKEVAIYPVEDWIANAERYLDTIRSEPQRQDWERNVAMARSHLGNMQQTFNEHLSLLQQGKQLDSLPRVTLPYLPQIPKLESLMGHVVYPLPRLLAPMQTTPWFPSAPVMMPVPSHRSPTPATTHSDQTRTSPQPVALASQPKPATAFHASSAGKLNRASSAAQPTVLQHTSAPTSSDAAQRSSKLDKLLENLGTKFPQCNRTQLKTMLQQIKTSRGTMAGLSVEELSLQVAQRLAQMEEQAFGPIGTPSAAREFPTSTTLPLRVQRPVHPSQGPAVAQVFHMRPPQAAAPSSRKLCLMCQNPVEAGSQHSMSCTHTVHKECISMWLLTNENSCPFCPSK